MSMLERMDVVAEYTNIKSSPPPNLPLAPGQYTAQHFDILNNVLRLYFNRLSSANQAIIADLITLFTPQSGTTAGRPVTNLGVGQYYFDTTLGLPIWWNGSIWVNAAGTGV